MLYLTQSTEDPDVSALSFAQAKAQLEDALQNIKAIRLEQESKHAAGTLEAAPLVRAEHPRLALDEFELTHLTQRLHLPLGGAITGPTDKPQHAAPPICRSSHRSRSTRSRSLTTLTSLTGSPHRSTSRPTCHPGCGSSTQAKARPGDSVTAAATAPPRPDTCGPP